MKQIFIPFSILLFSLAPALYAQPPVKAIVGGTLINPNGTEPVEGSVILIEDHGIVKVGKLGEIKIPKDAQVFNAEGKWIIPGLIDTHVHFFQSGGLYTRPDVIDLREYRPYEEERSWIKEHLPDTFARYLRSGVTSVVDVGGPTWNFRVREAAQETDLAPRVAVAGPLISTYRPEEFAIEDPPIIKVDSVEEAQALVRRQVTWNPDLIKIWFIVFPGQDPKDYLPLIKAIVEESHRHGLRVAVHATELETARTAVKAGADILVHSVDDREVDEEFIQLLKKNHILYTPTLLVSMRYREVLSQQLQLILPEHEMANPYILSMLFDLRELPADIIPQSVLNRIKNPGPISPNPIALKNLKLLHDAGVTITAGTDAGNIGTPHGPAIFREFELMAKAGLSAQQILKAATVNGAQFMGRQEELGTVEEGKLADMVILNSNPLSDIRNTSDIYRVVKDGHVYEPAQIIKKTPEDVVQQQVNAYNARNIEAFLATYSPDVKIFAHPDRLRLSGPEQIRKAYRSLFERVPSLHGEIVNRLVLGNFVVDQEKITGSPKDPWEAVIIYEVRDGLIQRVWFIGEDNYSIG